MNWEKFSKATKVYLHLMYDGVLVILNYKKFTPLSCDTGSFDYLFKLKPEELDNVMLDCVSKIPACCKELVFCDDFASETDYSNLVLPETLESIIINDSSYVNDKIQVTYIKQCEECGEEYLTNSYCLCKNCI